MQRHLGHLSLLTASLCPAAATTDAIWLLCWVKVELEFIAPLSKGKSKNHKPDVPSALLLLRRTSSGCSTAAATDFIWMLYWVKVELETTPDLPSALLLLRRTSSGCFIR